MKKLRFYHSYDKDGNHLCGIIAETAKEAKKLVYQSEYDQDSEWIEISIKWVKGVDISGFNPGIFNENNDCFEGIKRGLFNSQGEGCEYCDSNKECTEFLEKKQLKTHL